MAKFGQIFNRRDTSGEYFGVYPEMEVEANQIYWPNTASGLFGVAEHPVKKNRLGNFATTGVFWFKAPTDSTFAVGDRIPVEVTAQIASVVTSHGAGSPKLFIGWAIEPKASGSEDVHVLLHHFQPE